MRRFESLRRKEFRMGEAAGQVFVVLDGLQEVCHGAGQALSAGNHPDLYGLAATADTLDTELVDARILGIKELCGLNPVRIRDIRHPVREA